MESDPQLIIWRKSRLDPVTGEKSADIRLVATPIARVSADALAEILLYLRYERVSSRQIEAGERVIGRLETSRQGTGVEGLRRRDFLICNLGRPEVIDCERLRDSERRKVRVGPGDGAVAVQLGVIAVPGGRAVVGLRVVVVAVAVPA